jgi:hypothetical protein
MATPSHTPKHALNPPRRRRALLLLAGSTHDGVTEAVMKAHGFTTEHLVELVRAGLATATPQRVRAGREVLDVVTLRITDKGRLVLAAAKA